MLYWIDLVVISLSNKSYIGGHSTLTRFQTRVFCHCQSVSHSLLLTYFSPNSNNCLAKMDSTSREEQTVNHMCTV